MYTHRASFQVAVIAAILTTGCTPAILIVTPDRNNPNDPVTQAVVTFTPNFKPAEAWYVDLDGTNLAGFSPAPATGGTSSVPLVITGAGSHTITAQGTCGTFCSYPSDSVTFTLPALIYNSTSYVRVDRDLKQFQPTPVFVGVQNFRSVPINVSIVETSSPKHVKLALPLGAFQPPGNAITVTIPAGTTKADFQIQGDVLGTYVLGFTAPGVVSGPGAGRVNP